MMSNDSELKRQMTWQEIVAAVRQWPIVDQLEFIETIVRSIRLELIAASDERTGTTSKSQDESAQ